MRLTDFLSTENGIGKPVAYYPNLVKITGSIENTILILQLMYWYEKGHDKDGWVYKTVQEITSETGMSYKQSLLARKKLIKLKFLEEKNNKLEHKLFFKLDRDAINLAWEDMTKNDGAVYQRESGQFTKGKVGSAQRESGECPKGMSYKEQRVHTENTSYILCETSSHEKNNDINLSEQPMVDGSLVKNETSSNELPNQDTHGQKDSVTETHGQKFSLVNYLLNGKSRNIKLMGVMASIKRIKADNAAQAKIFIGIQSRWMKQLIDANYTDNQIVDTMEYLNKNTNIDWNIHTVCSYMFKDREKLNNPQPFKKHNPCEGLFSKVFKKEAIIN